RDAGPPLNPPNREGEGRPAAPPIERAIERGGRPMRLARVVPLLTAILLLGAVGPVLAQTFVFGAEGEPVSFDPAVITDGVSQRVTTQVYDNLVRYKGATTDVEPALAER